MLDRLPDEMKLTVFGFLPRKVKVQIQSVSIEWLCLLRDYSLWLETGANDYQNFTLRIRLISTGLQNLIWAGIYTITLSEDIQRINSLNVKQRQTELVTTEQAALMPDFPCVYHLDSLLSKCGVMALKENLITPEQAASINKWEYLKALLSEHGIQALRYSYITVEQVNAFPTVYHLETLLSKRGLQALCEKLISAGDVANLPTTRHIKYLIDENGLNALRLNLINTKEAATYKPSSLREHIIQILEKYNKENTHNKSLSLSK